MVCADDFTYLFDLTYIVYVYNVQNITSIDILSTDIILIYFILGYTYMLSIDIVFFLDNCDGCVH